MRRPRATRRPSPCGRKGWGVPGSTDASVGDRTMTSTFSGRSAAAAPARPRVHVVARTRERRGLPPHPAVIGEIAVEGHADPQTPPGRRASPAPESCPTLSPADPRPGGPASTRAPPWARDRRERRPRRGVPRPPGSPGACRAGPGRRPRRGPASHAEHVPTLRELALEPEEAVLATAAAAADVEDGVAARPGPRPRVVQQDLERREVAEPVVGADEMGLDDPIEFGEQAGCTHLVAQVRHEQVDVAGQGDPEALEVLLVEEVIVVSPAPGHRLPIEPRERREVDPALVVERREPGAPPGGDVLPQGAGVVRQGRFVLDRAVDGDGRSDRDHGLRASGPVRAPVEAGHERRVAQQRMEPREGRDGPLLAPGPPPRTTRGRRTGPRAGTPMRAGPDTRRRS